jgi:hypothetical protein
MAYYKSYKEFHIIQTMEKYALTAHTDIAQKMWKKQK